MAVNTGSLVQLVVLLAACLGCQGRAVVEAPTEGLELTLVHVNDMHARYEQTNALSGTCADAQAKAGKCYGGHARVATVIKEARQQDKNVLVLNAGDTYQGTVYYSLFKWKISAEFINLLKFDALTLGNHEFDDHTAGLVPFIQNLKGVPLIVANLDFSQEPEYAGLDIRKSVVVERDGVKIGIIGYLTPDTTFLSSPDKVTFSDEIEALTAEAAKLKQQGVHIIIGLGHSGYQKDQEVALKVPDIDLVVGGHSHTFLYTGDAPDSDIPLGLYPTYITQPSGRRVPVVQAYAFTKYIGKLKLKFDANGELTSLEGGPILLNKDIAQDPETLQEVTQWKKKLDSEVLQPLGRTTVLLDGKSCRAQECNFGNLIGDAFVYSRAEFLKYKNGWTDAPIALLNGGSIRTSIDASANNGTITMQDVMEAMPFDNLEVMIKLKGSVLLEALEHSVAEYVVGMAWKGQFLQMSGVHVVYDVSRKPQQRVVSVEVRCGDCTIPSYSPLDTKAVYGVVVSGFLANGGDGFSMLANNEGTETLQDTDAAVVERYIQKRGLVYPAVENRIVFQTSTPTTPASPASPTSPTTPSTETPPNVAGRATPGTVLLACALLLAAITL